MTAKEFKEFLMKSDDKVGVLKSPEVANHLNFTLKELFETFRDVMSQDEIFSLLKTYKKFPPLWKRSIITYLPDDKKLELIFDKEFSESLSDFDVATIVDEMQDEGKIGFLSNKELLEEKQMSISTKSNIIGSLSPDKIKELLDDPQFVKDVLGDSADYYVKDILEKIPDENERISLAKKMGYRSSFVASVLETCSDQVKQEELLKDEIKLEEYEYTKICGTMDLEAMSSFYETNYEFFKEKKIEFYKIVSVLPKEKQLEIAEKLPGLNLPEEEIVKSLVKLDQSVKDQLDRSHFEPSHAQVLDIVIPDFDFKVKDSGYINIDWEKETDFEKYKYLDKFIAVRPQAIPKEYRGKILELGKVCPDINVRDNIGLADSTLEEYKNGQAWMDEVLEQVDPNWSDIQKCAFIDNAIGKRISYSPDFGTERFDASSARALWRIADSRYGVCNGLAQLEQYMLKDVGVESIIISSGSHSFLKLENIEVPQADGTTLRGDTILDPTWNLSSHRFNAFPDNFFKSYEEIRKHDILPDGTDKKCHFNDEELSSCTLDLEEKAVRQLFASIGLARENGEFPIADLSRASQDIAKQNGSLEEKIDKQLQLLKNMHPDFSSCLNSSTSIISGVLLNHDEMPFEKLVTDRVYNKEDDEKRKPVLYIYCKSKDKELFYVAENGAKDFSKLDRESFIMQYDCFDKDLEKSDGIRPWEEGSKEVAKDLAQSSGKVLPASEGDKNVEERKNEQEGDER